MERDRKREQHRHESGYEEFKLPSISDDRPINENNLHMPQVQQKRQNSY